MAAYGSGAWVGGVLLTDQIDVLDAPEGGSVPQHPYQRSPGLRVHYVLHRVYRAGVAAGADQHCRRRASQSQQLVALARAVRCGGASRDDLGEDH
jgi:hypothetical protein